MIIAECRNDQALIYRMGFTPNQVGHEYGRSRVLGRVEQEKKTVIGIVDEDPRAGKNPKMNEYEVQKGSTRTISLLKRKDNNTKRLIRISPYFEDWLCQVAKRNKLSPKDFSLPEDPRDLHGISFRKNSDARRFLEALVRTKDDEINTLRKWIEEAIE